MLKPNKRANIKNALIAALAREGVQVTPDRMDKALTWVVEGDPVPEYLPESITVGGIVLAWPRGRDTRVPSKDERVRWNTALRHVESNEVLTDEHNVRLYREVYEAMADDVKNTPELALPPITVREIEAAKALIAKETPVTPPVIEHVAPSDVLVSTLDKMQADLAALVATLG
jgi:hypothetical protein